MATGIAWAVAAVLAAVPALGGVAAQEPGDVRLNRAGTLVRIAAPGVADRTIEGQATEFVDGVLTVRTSDGPDVRIPRDAIERLEYSTGRSGHPGWGAVIGTVAIGVPAAIYWSRECEGGSSCDRAGVKAFFGAGLVFGGLPGALVGALIRTRDWELLPLDYLDGAMGDPGLTLVPAVEVDPGGRWSVGVKIPLGGPGLSPRRTPSPAPRR